MDFALSIHISGWCVCVCVHLCVHLCVHMHLLYQSLIVVVECDAGGFLTLLLQCTHLNPPKVLMHQLFAHEHLCDIHTHTNTHYSMFLTPALAITHCTKLFSDTLTHA